MDTGDIKNIIFDLGGVILNIDYQKTSQQFKQLGLCNFDQLYSQFQQNNLFDDLETGNISEFRFIKKLQESIPGATDDNIINAWNAMLLDLPQTRIDLLSKVKSHYNIMLLSNTNIIHFKAYMDYIKSSYDLDFNSLFNKAYYSHEIGLRKPTKECFQFVLDENNLGAHETLFLDDSIQHIEGAKSIGIHTIHHTNGCITDLFNNNGFLK
jgi:putative hydrolase of the HAD superfamily